MELLTIKNLFKTFGNDESEVIALSDINFVIRQGEFVAIMGASGSGKTTLLNCISTIDKPTSGEIYFKDFDLVKATENELSDYRAANVSYIFQSYNLIGTLTVYENIVLPLQIQGRKIADNKVKIEDIMAKLDIKSLRDKFPDQLSGGQRQRVATARALVDDSKILIADEPTGALDSVNSENLLDLFATINRDLEATILMVTHDADAAKYSSRILVLKDGRIKDHIERGELSQEDYLQRIYQATR